MNSTLDFVEDTLRYVASQVLASRGERKATHTDIKGYLAEADIYAHETMVEQIKRQFPDDMICSEEDDEESRDCSRQKMSVRTWVLDPICGTANYLRGLPFYTHSLSAIDGDGVCVGGIYNPSMDEMFLADKEMTTLNNVPVKVSNVERLSEAIIDINCNLSDKNLCRQKLQEMVGLFAPPVTRRIRIMESANLELAYIACGRIDGYINRDDKIWDIAAGSLMIASAGGSVFTCSGNIHDFSDCRGVIAGNKHIAAILQKTLSERGAYL